MSQPEQPDTQREPSATGGIDPDPPDPGVARGWAPHTFLAMGLLLASIFCRDDALLLATSALLLASAWAAWLLARRDPRHRPVRDGLLVAAACMLVREAIHVTVLHGGPYTGWARAAFHLEEATRLVTAAVPAWIAISVFLPRVHPSWSRWFAARVFVGGFVMFAIATCVFAYPELRGGALRRVYLGAELASLFVALLAVASWVRQRGWRLPVAHEHQGAIVVSVDDPGGPAGSPVRSLVDIATSHAALPRWYTTAPVLMLVGGDLALLLVGAWRWGLFGAAYVVQQWGLLALFGAIAVAQAVALRRRA